jgi:hypothetical protein
MMTNFVQTIVVGVLVGGALAYMAWGVYRWWTRPVSGCGSSCGGCSHAKPANEKPLVSLDVTPSLPKGRS